MAYVRVGYKYKTREAILTFRDHAEQLEVRMGWVLDKEGSNRRPSLTIAKNFGMKFRPPSSGRRWIEHL